MEWIEQLFENYGYLVLFVGLLLEYIALPFPGETTLTYAGYLSFEGILAWEIAVIVAFTGTTIGMTISYWIGYFIGMPFIRKYGKWFFLSEKKIDKTSKWFAKYGNTLIFIGYFIPGIRHLTGYFSGIVRLPFRTFAIYAYAGAATWVLLFIWLGKWFGPQWQSIFHLLEKYLALAIICAVIVVLTYIAIRYHLQLRILYRKWFGKFMQ